MSNIYSGRLCLLLGPSGIGKGTTLRLFRERHPEFVYPVSCTTRAPRPGEVDGETYYFISEEQFRTHIEAGDFLEYAFIHQQQYTGLLKAPVIEALKAGKLVLRELDYQGYAEIMKTEIASAVVSIFLTVDDPLLLLDRIAKRSPLSPEETARRLETAKQELAGQEHYDHVVRTQEGNPEAVYQEVESLLLSYTKAK